MRCRRNVIWPENVIQIVRGNCYWLTALLALASLRSGDAQIADQKCVVEGAASDAITGEVLRKVTVELGSWLPASAASYHAVTDASGRFHFEAIPPGEYRLREERPGYLQTSLGASRAGSPGTILRLKAGDRVSDLPLKLTRASIIAGKITDELGQPVEALVNAYRPAWINGHREYFVSGQGSTDQAGEFRITGLAAGRYYLYVSSGNNAFLDEQGKPEKRLLSVFYPNARGLSEASPVEVLAGENMTGINFRLHAVETFHVRGRLSTPLKSDLPVSVIAVHDGLDRRAFDLDETEVDKNGSFQIGGLPRGAYTIEVVSERKSPYSAGSLPIEIKGRDLNGIVLPVNTAVGVSGKIHFEEGAAHVTGTTFVFFDALTGSYSDTDIFAIIKEDGTFQASVPPHRYILALPTASDKDYVKSASHGGQDILGQPVDFSQGAAGEIEIVVAPGAGRVEGRVTVPSQNDSDKGQEVWNGVEVALVSDHPRWDSAGAFTTSLDQSGHFSFKGVPPGRYYAFASATVDNGVWRNREFFDQIRSSGVQVDLPEKGRVEIQVTPLDGGTAERALAALGPQ